MAMRSMPFADWNANREAAVFAAGAAIAAALALTGQSQVALILLAALGVAAAGLMAVGQMRLQGKESRIDARLREILSILPAAAAITDRKGAVLWASEAFLRSAGSPEAGQDLSRLGDRDPEAAAAIFRLFNAARDGDAHEEIVTAGHVQNGEPVLLRVTPFYEPGKRTQFFVWQIDNAKRAQAIEAPADALVCDLPVPAFIMAKDFSVTGANKAFEDMTGVKPSGSQAWPFFRTRRGKPSTRTWLRDSIAKAEPIAVQIVSASGGSRAASLHVRAYAGGYVCLAVPAGACGNLDEAFEMLLSRAPAPMAVTNLKGVTQAVNGAFRDLFARADPEVNEGTGFFGKPLSLLVADASTQTVRDRIAALAGGNAFHNGPIEIQAALKSSESERVRLVIYPAANETHLIVSVIEAGAPALSSEQAAQSQKLQAVGELAGGIAHDFNNLLTAIIGNSDLLLRRFRASDSAFKELMDIKNSATRAAELVKQILAYSRRQTLRPAILKLTDVIEEFQATMGRTLGEKVKAKVQHGRDLWFVKADEGQIFQVIMNLAVNARDAMPDGGEITIKTANVSERESMTLKDRGLDRGEYVLCEVRDTGTGIKPEHIEKIFDPFFSTKEVGKGTGLGLSTVYGIVKQTGGTILVNSQPGDGTTFQIYLPRYVETEEDLKALENKAEGPEHAADLTGRGKVLLVEDEDAVRSFASRALATRGYTVLEASSGIEALEIMDREHGQVDLVVSDVVMPEMDGPTLLRHLRERNPGIRIVFMSGYAEEAFRKNLSAGENFIFLPKPFTLKKLAETVKAAAA
jgi:two-component system, cell cycle sensor histidine kinase and response regulator CckA